MYIGPREVLLTLELQFEADTPATRITETIESIEAEVKRRFPKISRIYIEARANLGVNILANGGEGEQARSQGS